MSPQEPLDLAGPLRSAILTNTSVTALLSTWQGEPAVFTKRPVPANATYPLIVVSPDASVGNIDFLSARLPMPRRDLIVYGRQNEDPDQYRAVEAIAYLLRQQFHRQKFSVDPGPGYQLIELVVTSVMPAPVDDVNTVARAVLLHFKLRDLATA